MPRATVAKLVGRAWALRQTLGTRCAAGFLRNRGLDFEQAHLALFGLKPRFSGSAS